MGDDGYQADKDNAYRALGRYVAEFSRLIWRMRSGITRTLSGDDNQLAELALGEANPYQITTAFFAICAEVAGDFNDDEKAIADLLQRTVTDELKRRNDYAHGDWWIGWGSADEMEAPWLDRVKPGRKQGPFVTTSIPSEKLDAESDGLVVLRNLVAEYAEVCLRLGMYAPQSPYYDPDVRVKDVLMIEGSRRSGHVVRRPDASRPTHYS